MPRASHFVSGGVLTPRRRQWRHRRYNNCNGLARIYRLLARRVSGPLAAGAAEAS